MDAYEAIEKRRTIRAFTRGASEEQLRKIILAGTRAMSARNCQPWEFIIVDDTKIIDQLASYKYQFNSELSAKRLKQEFGVKTTQDGISKTALEQRKAYQNCSVVAVCHQKGEEQVVSAWMCIQNMALAATIEGLGVVPSGFLGGHKEAVEKLLGIPAGYELTTVLLIGVQEGYPDQKFADIARRREFSWLRRNRFGSTP